MDEEAINKQAIEAHKRCKGKIEIIPKCPIRSLNDFSIWYTPGVAAVCKKINENEDSVFDYTNKWNSVAIISDGTRVLGLGNIGPKAGIPVMEGKAMLFKYFGGVDAIPICLGTTDKDKIIETVKNLQPSFGGINLEDIEKPKCFEILETLKKEMHIPVFHDDQQGTATVILAGLINAMKVVGKRTDEVSLTMVGAGAAGFKTVEMLIKAGFDPKKIIIADSKGILNQSRDDIKNGKGAYKWEMCIKTNGENREGGVQEALKGSDICIALSKPGPGTIKKEWISKMSDDAIVFPCANPIPEIMPDEAKEAGARIVATGRSDFPNQVNNSIGFPGIFRGVLDVRAKTITDGMCLAVANEIARFAEEKGINEDYIIPNMNEWELYPREAVSIGMEAIKEGLARKKFAKSELYSISLSTIERSRKIVQTMMKNKLVK